jgi:phosphoribosylformylglycinamidine synthase
MKRGDIRVCIMRTGGTNCDSETKAVFDYLGTNAEVVHSNQFYKGRKVLEDYDSLVFPGGFSNGDYVRAGAIWAADLKADKRILRKGKTYNGYLQRLPSFG